MKLEQVFEEVVAEVDTERTTQMVEKLSKFLQVTATLISDDDPHYMKKMPERVVAQSPFENEVSRFMHLQALERGAEWW